MSDEHPLLNQNTDLKFRALKKKSPERVERNQSIKNLKRWKMWHSTGSLNYFIPLISFYTPQKTSENLVILFLGCIRDQWHKMS